MPKEGVFGEQHHARDEKGEVIIDERPQVPVVNVLWGRDGGYVQIVSKVEDPHGGRWIGEGDWDEGVSHVTDGMYVNLDRPAINKLIRNLRRARDQAFGRDE